MTSFDDEINHHVFVFFVFFSNWQLFEEENGEMHKIPMQCHSLSDSQRTALKNYVQNND